MRELTFLLMVVSTSLLSLRFLSEMGWVLRSTMELMISVGPLILIRFGEIL